MFEYTRAFICFMLSAGMIFSGIPARASVSAENLFKHKVSVSASDTSDQPGDTVITQSNTQASGGSWAHQPASASAAEFPSSPASGKAFEPASSSGASGADENGQNGTDKDLNSDAGKGHNSTDQDLNPGVRNSDFGKGGENATGSSITSSCIHVISGTSVTPGINRVKKGEQVTYKGNTYVITRATTYRGDGSVKNAGEAALLKTGKNKVKIIVPGAVKAAGVSCRVTLVKKKAFSYSKNAAEITIGKNVADIRKNAFRGLKKLKLITIRSGKLAAIRGSRTMALGKVKINVPNSRIPQYTALIKRAGGKRAVVI